MLGSTVYVGVDVARDTLEAAFLTEEARTAHANIEVANTPVGWASLCTIIVEVVCSLGREARAVCGMESTSNMHMRLEEALRAEQRCPIEVHTLNPRAVKNFGKALLRDAKTDRLDSQLIALFLLRMRPAPTQAMPENFEAFREATRTRRRLIECRTEEKNRLHKMLRYHFPGYRGILGRTLPKRLLIVLAAHPSPNALLACSIDALADIRYGRGHRVGPDYAEGLHTLAAQAPQSSLPQVTRLLLRRTAERILQLESDLAELDAAIEQMLTELFPDQILTSIPGIGAVSAAAILAEVGDIGRFDDVTAFVGYCGLYPVVWESGRVKRRYRMTRKGNRMLKMTLLVASASARQYNPVIAAYYKRLRDRGKSKRAAGGAIARKLATLVFTLLQRNELWSDSTAQEGLDKARTMLKKAA